MIDETLKHRMDYYVPVTCDADNSIDVSYSNAVCDNGHCLLRVWHGDVGKCAYLTDAQLIELVSAICGYLIPDVNALTAVMAALNYAVDTSVVGK